MSQILLDALPSGMYSNFVVFDYACPVCRAVSHKTELMVIATDHFRKAGGQLLRGGLVISGADCGCQAMAFFPVRGFAPGTGPNCEREISGVVIDTDQNLASLPRAVYGLRHNFCCGRCGCSSLGLVFEAYLTDYFEVGSPLKRMAFWISKPPCGCSVNFSIGLPC